MAVVVRQGNVYHRAPDAGRWNVTAADGTLVWAGYIRGFGENAADISNSGAYFHQPLRLPGQYFDDETGLHYNLFRYYAPECGRFVSQDPIGLKGGLNLYSYAPNPLRWIDPLGLHQLIAFLNGEAVINPEKGSGGLWNHDWGSRKAPFNGYGATGHSEAKLLEHLDTSTYSGKLSGSTLEMHSLGQMLNNGTKHLSEIPACPTCQDGIADFAKNKKMNITYSWTDSSGVKQTTKWDSEGNVTHC